MENIKTQMEIKALKEGKLDLVPIDLENWLKTENFPYLIAFIEGLSKNKRSITIYNIFLCVNQVLLLTDNRETEKWCEKVLASLIKAANSILAQEENLKCQEILETLSQSKNESVRLQCCANNSNYRVFLKDSNAHIQRVATIRAEFEDKWETFDELTKRRILFLTTALEYNAISYHPEEIMIQNNRAWIRLSSDIFQKVNSQMHPFDIDIFFTITDKRILASLLNQMILSGKILLSPDMIPQCYKDSIKRTRVVTSNKKLN